MSNRITLKLLSITFLVSTVLPVAAQDESNQANQQTSGSSGALDRVSKTAKKLPIATVSFVVGSIVGTPISMFRHSADQVNHASKGIAKGMHSPFSAPIMIVLGPPAIIAGGLGGVFVQGPWNAIGNSWANSLNKPFSKDAFSLGPLEKWDD